jgi:DNA invertase Pin-like site-specific DNA recombinase
MTHGPVGHSYLRFSSKRQRKGDSIRRQTEDTAAGESPASWCARNGVTYSTKTYHDLGLSARHGKNAKQGELKAFLDAIDAGSVRPGDYLLVERIDRISRQGVDEGYELCKRILKAGVHIVTLFNGRVFGPDAVKGLMKGALELQVYLEQAQQYSDNLSARARSAHEGKRKKARDGKGTLSAKPPGWLRVDADGKPELIPERAAVVRRIFDMAIDGKGVEAIVKRLTADKVPPMGYADAWNKTYVHNLLTGRQVLGEVQPGVCLRDAEGREVRQAEGAAIAGHYPAAIEDEGTWLRAQAALASRKRQKGRPPSGTVNVFKGLLYDARDGGTVMLHLRTVRGGRRHHVLTPVAATQGRTDGATFPFATFEKGVLALLAEIDPDAILPPKVDDAVAAEAKALSDERDAIDARLALIQAELEQVEQGVDFSTMRKAVRTLTERKREVEGKLAVAKQRAAAPASEAWGEFKTLLDALNAAPDPAEARVRLRAALSRVVDSIYLLMTGRGNRRYAAVQINFSDGNAARRYCLYHRQPFNDGRKSRPGLWWASSFTPEVIPDGMTPIDLRTCGREVAERFAADLPDVIDAAVEASMNARRTEEAGRGVVRSDEETDEALRELDRETPWGEIPLPQPNAE